MYHGTDLSLLIALLAILVCLSAGMEKSVVADISPFRINKMNFIWAKAVSHISDKSVIKRIKNELEKFDKLYLSAKEQREKYGRSDLEEIDEKLGILLEKYGLEAALSAYNKKMKWRNEEELKKTNDVLASEKFTDPKIMKLWRAAQDAKFSESQLKALHKELKDHERRMEEYNEKVLKFNEVPHENSLDDDVAETREKMSSKLKEHFNEMESNYERLHNKVLQSEKSPFKNDKAMKNENFTARELESIRHDLHHFDMQMEKLKYHEEELKAAQELHKQSGKVGVINEGLTEFEEKTERIKRKLRKFGNFLETKIGHTEL
ncbi:Alpha-2-macroglobulin receptor-associated protein [Toxocara canis]|uniref:Alpha-2-macroglobulin receptor-associated protein n=1 Tax=Toxocara canis TaxID=6265 RepID=A0A0B2V5P2_TOXCA|nr:Alpha-2-macroglobulin receptor-associated protein [Toxocara canis]